jgi:uncharacterized paraquat-inducible protein A
VRRYYFNAWTRRAAKAPGSPMTTINGLLFSQAVSVQSRIQRAGWRRRADCLSALRLCCSGFLCLRPVRQRGARAATRNCGIREDSLNRTLALTLAGALLYVIANSVPMLGLTIVGRAASTTVIGGVQTLWQDGQEIVAVLVFYGDPRPAL